MTDRANLPSMRLYVCSFALAFATLAGCAGSPPKVDWGGKYAASEQTRLDKLIADKDCASLRAELATAKSINAAKKRMYGSGSEDLVAYITWGQHKAGCKDAT